MWFEQILDDSLRIFLPEYILLQRGSDELLSQSGAVSNGASMSPQPHHAADNNNDAKKVSDSLIDRSSVKSDIVGYRSTRFLQTIHLDIKRIQARG